MSQEETTSIPPKDKEMTIVQHLLELRNVMTKSILAIVVLFIVLFPFANELYLYISEPLTRFLPDDTSMIATGVASPFLTPFKLSLVLAVYLAMPFLLFQIWNFIAPALYEHEKQLVGPIMFFSSFLFYSGGAFAFYVVFPLVFGFLSTTAPDGVTIATDISLYLDFVIKMFFAFGIAFEVPIVVVLLILTGMAKPEKLRHIRPYIVVGAFIIGMLLTPPDVISQTLLAVPMWLLYEAGIIVGAWTLKVRKRRQEDDDNEEPASTTEKDPASSSNVQAEKQADKTVRPNMDPTNMPENLGNDDHDEDYNEQFDRRQTQDKLSQASEKASDYDPMYDDPDYDPYDMEDAVDLEDSEKSKIEQDQYDDRYADQVDDDLDWDAEFEKINSEMSALEKEYNEKQQRLKAEQAAQKKADDEKGDVEQNAATDDRQEEKQDENKQGAEPPKQT